MARRNTRDGGRPPLRWTAFGVVVLAAVVAGGLFLGQRLVIVSGTSMLPSAETGDLVVIWPAADYEVGDNVVYRVPDGRPGGGTRVYHRVVERLDGRLVFQGDNNTSPDPWRLPHDAVIGREVVRVPNLGWVVHYGGQPAVLASLAAALVAGWAASRSVEDDLSPGT